MGLTLYYNWKHKADPIAARRMVVDFHKLAQQLPFDEVSEIYEQDPPNGETEFCLYDEPFRQGDLYLTRKRSDGLEEFVRVPARHSMFFFRAGGGGGKRFDWPGKPSAGGRASGGCRRTGRGG